MEWSVLEKVGIAGVAIVAIYFGFQMFKIFIAQWSASTEAINRNTAGFTKLSETFSKSDERQEVFQKEVIDLLKDGKLKETNAMVKEIHGKVVQ